MQPCRPVEPGVVAFVAQRQQQMRGVVAFVAGCSCFVLLATSWMIPVGTAALASARSMNPSADFTHLPDGCEIVGVEHHTADYTESTSSDGTMTQSCVRCVDTYDYRFRVRGELEMEGFDSVYGLNENFHRCRDCKDSGDWDGCPCGSGPAPPASRANNETFDCWVPTADPNDVDDRYTCEGNPDCVKRSDPADDKAGVVDDARGMFVGGIVAVVVSSVCCCCSFAAGVLIARQPELVAGVGTTGSSNRAGELGSQSSRESRVELPPPAAMQLRTTERELATVGPET